MSSNKIDELTDSQVQMYLDGLLKGSSKIEFEERIATEPAIRKAILEYKALDKQFSHKLGANLFTNKTKDKPKLFYPNWQLAGSFAMGVMVAFFLIKVTPESNEPHYAQQAIVAHFKYSPQEHIENDTQSLSFDTTSIIENSFNPPNLMPIGLELVGYRQLNLDEGKSVQLMYHDKKGERYTVMITQNQQNKPVESGFYDTQLAQVSHWHNDNFNFAITGIKQGLNVRDIQPLIAANF